MPRTMLTCLYRALLYLYPRRFRAEFAEEMEAVFEETVGEATGKSRKELARTILAEICCLPGEAIRLAFQGCAGKILPKPGGAIWEGPPTTQETLVTLAVFALPVANLWMNSAPAATSAVLLLCMATLLAGGFVAGLRRGFPRWSLPYLGLALSAVSFVFVFQWASDRIAPAQLVIPSQINLFKSLPQDESISLLLQAFWSGLMWLSLFAVTFFALGLLALLRRFHPLLARLRQDWTLVSYILYSGTLFTLGLTFNRYHQEQPHALASSLCLVTGAWLYLRSAHPWQRTLSLLAGITLAMGSAFASQLPAQLIQDWGGWLGAQPHISAGWQEPRRLLLAWGWMVLVLLAPAFVKLPSGSQPRLPTTR